MLMVSFLKKTQEIKEQSNLLPTLLLLQGGQMVMRMQAGDRSCLVGKMVD